MKISTIKPKAILSPYISEFWILENNSRDHSELVYPTGEVQILFHYGTPFLKHFTSESPACQPQMAVCGQNLISGRVLSQKNSGVIGLVFNPHGAAAFLPFPVNEITNLEIDVADIFNDWGRYKNRFLDCQNNQQRIAIIENFLLQKFNISNPVHYNIIKESIYELKQSKGRLPVHKLAKKYFISERNYERLFNKFIGINPKKTADIFRFNYAVELLSKSFSATEISYLSGYYDQAHFIRNFKRFSGITPGKFRELI